MASVVRLSAAVSAKDIDGTRFVYPSKTVTVYRESDRTVIGSASTNGLGILPDITVSDAIGTAVLLTVEPYRGIAGTVKVYTIAA